MTRKNTQRQDIYSRVTNKIIADLEQGVRSWVKPWSAEHASGRITRPLRHNGQAYSGINVLMLWGSAVEHGFSAPTWMTFRQAVELGAHVRKGEKGSPVVYANTLTRTEESDNGEQVEYQIPYMKSYSVFNVEQIEDLPGNYYETPEPRFNAPQRIDHAESFFAETNAALKHGGNRAYYSVGSDHVQMPCFESFRDPESYYATLAHELTHWTRHKSRLDRSFGRKHFGDEGYAREELVAELGSAFLCADLELTLNVRDDHSAYIASWLKVLKNDKRAVFSAAAHAQRAADYLHSLQNASTKSEVA
ncbi:MAG: zincin-like metallopeptidase domain-containing protein [Gammaproteobacteria bacterium]